MRSLKLGLAGVVLFFAFAGCRGIQIGTPEVSSASTPTRPTAAGPPPPAESTTADAKEASPFVTVNDLQARATAAQEKLASDPTGAAKELAAIREELLTRWSKLESTQPQPADGQHIRPRDPFYSDTLTKDAKDLLASTHALRAGLWTDQGKVDDALREMISTMSGVSSVPCPTKNAAAAEACQRARTAITTKYTGFCFNDGSSNCSASLDDDSFAFPDPKKSTLYARAWVKKVIPTKGSKGGFDLVTGDVPATDLEVCKGEFQTDKILDVNEKRILIERTTWCKEMAKQRRTGWRITHHVSGLPVAIKPGDHIVVIADASKVKRTKTAEMITASSASTVLAVERSRPLYRWNDVTPQ